MTEQPGAPKEFDTNASIDVKMHAVGCRAYYFQSLFAGERTPQREVMCKMSIYALVGFFCAMAADCAHNHSKANRGSPSRSDIYPRQVGVVGPSLPTKDAANCWPLQAPLLKTIDREALKLLIGGSRPLKERPQKRAGQAGCCFDVLRKPAPAAHWVRPRSCGCG